MERHPKLLAPKLMNEQRRELIRQEISRIYNAELTHHRDTLFIDMWLHIEALEARNRELAALAGRGGEKRDGE